MTADARVTAWLDRLEGLHTAATPGPWYPVASQGSAAGVVSALGSGNVAVCWEDPADAAAIVAEHNNFGSLLALARGVTALADELETTADSPINRAALAKDAAR